MPSGFPGEKRIGLRFFFGLVDFKETKKKKTKKKRNKNTTGQLGKTRHGMSQANRNPLKSDGHAQTEARKDASNSDELISVGKKTASLFGWLSLNRNPSPPIKKGKAPLGNWDYFVGGVESPKFQAG